MESFIIFFCVFVAVFIIKGVYENKHGAKEKQIRDEKLKNYNLSVRDEFYDSTIGVDEDKRLIVFVEPNKVPILISFDEIIDFEILKDSETISKVSAKGVIVGGVLAGGLGAIIGSQVGKKSKDKVGSLDLIIRVDKIQNATIKINFYEKKQYIPTLKVATETMDKWQGIMKVIMERNNN